MRKPKGHTAVMAQRAPSEVEGESPQRALQRKLQYYPTPPWAARAGGELIQLLDPGRWIAWEPACGEGHMVHGLKDYFPAVIRTDIHDHGWDGLDRVQDFLAVERGAATQADWIITNPPFGQAAEFVRLGLRRARRGVAILIRSAWYDSAGRWPIFCGDEPCDVRATFFVRPAMELGGWDPDGSTATSYAWFVWMQPDVGPGWLKQARGLMWPQIPDELGLGPFEISFPPTTKDRLSRRDDARLFGRRGDAPLLERADG